MLLEDNLLGPFHPLLCSHSLLTGHYQLLLVDVEQAVVYSTLPQEYSTLTFRGEVVAGGGGVEERSEVMYCIEERTYIYYRRA